MIRFIMDISGYEQLLVRFKAWLGIFAELGGILCKDHVQFDQWHPYIQ